MAYTRRECPVCGNNNRKHIDEVEDRKRPPIYHFTHGTKPMYAKKFICTDCKHEWSK